MPAPKGDQQLGFDSSSVQVVAPGNRSVRWEGFFVGPAAHSRGELTEICRSLLGIDLHAVESAARSELVPQHLSDKQPAVVIHSASPLKKALEGDIAALATGEPVEDVSTYFETRAVSLARDGDIVVGRTLPWRQAVQHSRVQAADVGHLEFYYLSHALLTLAVAHQSRSYSVIENIIGLLRARPKTVVRVYVLDLEMQIFLVWLKRRAGLAELSVQANGVDVSARWYHKTALHPSVEAASGLGPLEKNRRADAILEMETALTPFSQQLDLAIPRLPGYAISASAELPVQMQIVEAAQLLQARYGLRLGCLKPSMSGTGHGIVVGIQLDAGDHLTQIAEQVSETGNDYVLEAHAHYLSSAVGGYDFIHAPSTHINGAELVDGMMLQFMNGAEWHGNVHFDRRTCKRFGISLKRYAFIRRSTQDIIQAFSGRGPGMVLLNGGIDFAIARLGGLFEDAVVIGVQDLNLSLCGADSLLLFLDQARDTLATTQGVDPTDVYAATKVIQPRSDTDVNHVKAVVDSLGSRSYERAITCVPGRWGLIAAAATTPVQTIRKVLKAENRLWQENLLTASPHLGSAVQETIPAPRN